MGAALPVSAQDSSNPPYAVTDLGPYYRVWQRTVMVTNSLTGEVTPQVQGYTELGDGMNYWTTNGAQGQWAESQDLIEITPTGAQAVHGQLKAALSGDITRPGAITLTAPSGQVFQSHPIGLFYDDPASGKVAQIALVQASQGLLYAPNVIVFTNALSSPDADLMLVWAKNGFEQCLVLKQAPPTPESFGLSSGSCRLQMWTALDQWPDPLEERPALFPSGLVDHILIFSECWLPVGSAFAFGAAPLPPQGQAALVRPVSRSDTNAVPTAKSLATISGQKVLIEEINYNDLLPAFKTLSHASLRLWNPKAVEFADRAQLVPVALPLRARPAPFQLASAPYQPSGVLLDYQTLSGSANSYTFTNGTTYYIPVSFYVGPGTAAFQNNTCLKFGSNACLDAYGPVGFPSNGAPVVLTSKDDNAYGQSISNSTARPYYAASRALVLYYNGTMVTVQDALFRWAQYAIECDASPYSNNAAIWISAFQNCGIGVYVNMTSDTLYLSGDTCCNVTNPVSIAGGTVAGAITTDCGVVSVAMVNDPTQDSGDTNSLHDVNKNSESECAFILADNSQTIVAAFSDTHLDEMDFGATNEAIFSGVIAPRSTWWARSTNGGTSFTNTAPLPPANITNAWYGDAPNPVMAYDPGYPTTSNGTIYLLCNCARVPTNFMGFRLWTSSDKGANFSLINSNIPGGTWGISTVDRPMIKVNLTNHDLYVTGTASTGIFAAHSNNGGITWDLCKPFDTHGHMADIVITPSGTVYVTWVAESSTTNGFSNSIRYAWLLSGSNSWSGPTNLGITLNASLEFGYRHALRFNGDSIDDWFETIPFPRTAFANGHIYLVYSDIPKNSTNDQGDIFLAEANINSSNGSLTLITNVTVNNDRTQTDQWDPAIAVRPGSTEIFIGYYSRQEDTNNSLIRAYGAKGDVANGLANTTFDCFPIGPTLFQPLFAGTTASTNLLFDPVYPTGPVCLDTNGNLGCFPTWFTNSQGKTYWACACNGNAPALKWGNGSPNWFQDDNTWADADTNYFYYAWCDRSRIWTNKVGIQWQTYTNRPDADVKIARIRQ